MKLSKALENNIHSFNSCKTSEDVFKKTNWIINHNTIDDKKICNILQKCLKNSRNLEASMIYISSFMLNESKVSNKTLEKKSWFKGSSIHGMECSNSYR